MKYVITGATGHLGRLVVEALLERDVPADQIVAVGRALDRVGDLADRGVQVRAVDYNDVSSLREAFLDAQKVLLVSGSEVGQRTSQHQNVINAAKDAGVDLLVYTSVANADSTGLQLAAEHLATEKLLADSGLPHAVLRNSWYLENYTNQLAAFLGQGAVMGSAGDGRLSAATRADYAEAAALVLISDDQAGRTTSSAGTRPLLWPSWLSRSPRPPAVPWCTATFRPASTPKRWWEPVCPSRTPPSLPTPISASPGAISWSPQVT